MRPRRYEIVPGLAIVGSGEVSVIAIDGSSNSLASTVVCPGGVCDEAAISSSADTGSAKTDAVDAGDGTIRNGRLDLAGGRVWALVFTVVLQ